jgi:hypothetical protein
MSELDQFLEQLLFLPEDEVFPAGTDFTPYYRPWGFTIYRTAYEGSSEEHWHSLLDLIRTAVTKEITVNQGVDQTDPTAQQVMSLFRLDARSDPAVMDGLNIEETRKVYEQAIGGEPMNANWKERRVFLLVDDEVILEYGSMAGKIGHKPWIKCVEPYYVDSDHIPRNTWLGPRRYFGFMKMRASGVAGLWSLLYTRWLSEIAPRTVGGAHLEVWEDYCGI